jgi:hypothetical protein
MLKEAICQLINMEKLLSIFILSRELVMADNNNIIQQGELQT